MDKPLKIKILSIVLDCRDAHELADFYAAFLGWKNGAKNRKIGLV